MIIYYVYVLVLYMFSCTDLFLLFLLLEKYLFRWLSFSPARYIGILSSTYYDESLMLCTLKRFVVFSAVNRSTGLRYNKIGLSQRGSTTSSRRCLCSSSIVLAPRSAEPSANKAGSRPASLEGRGETAYPQELTKELQRHIESFPLNKWVKVSDLYQQLSDHVIQTHVKPHKTLLALLKRVCGHLDIVLHENGVYWCRGDPEFGSDGGSSSVQESPTPSASPISDNHPNHNNGIGVGGKTYLISTKEKSAKNPFSPHADAQSIPVDFYYDVELTEIPPPPKDFAVTPSSLVDVGPTETGSVISLKSFVSFIPYFFVPLTEVLKNMPGYTEQHIESYFHSPAVEMVTIEGHRFIRLYGGYGKIGLEGCEVSEELFHPYKPKLALAEPFKQAFEGVTDKWMPLSVLLSRVSPDVVEQLPFKGAAAIIYFAQMQHIFAFSVDSTNGGAVLLRPPGFGGLEAHTTPTPKSTNFLIRHLPMHGTRDVSNVEAAVPPPLMQEIKEYYGSLLACLEAHGPLFYVEPDHSVVMLTNYKRRLHVASLPLEEQLAIAMQKRDKAKIRTLRRRIAFRDNPSHPFHDPDNLAREVARHLPRKGFVTLKQFMKRSIAEELLFFMPKKTHNFFTKYPHLFTIFEFQHPGIWCLSRPEEPLPKGVIRQNFSDEDIVRLTAQYLQQKGPKACTQIVVSLPRGASDAIKKRHGGMYYLVTKYPQYFNVIIGSESNQAAHSAIVHLLKVPGLELSASRVAVKNEAKEGEGEEEEEEVQELSDAGEGR